MVRIEARQVIKVKELLASVASLIVFGLVVVKFRIVPYLTLIGPMTIFITYLTADVVRVLRNRSIVLRIDADGIEDTRTRIGRVSWDQIAELRRFGIRWWLGLRETDSPVRRTLWAFLNRPLGVKSRTGFLVHTRLLDVDADQIGRVLSDYYMKDGLSDRPMASQAGSVIST